MSMLSGFSFSGFYYFYVYFEIVKQKDKRSREYNEESQCIKYSDLLHLFQNLPKKIFKKTWIYLSSLQDCVTNLWEHSISSHTNNSIIACEGDGL